MKKDAEFVDKLGLLLREGETSIKLNPQVVKINQQYITARRGIKKRIQYQQTANEINTVAPESDDEQSDDEFGGNAFDNIFD